TRRKESESVAQSTSLGLSFVPRRLARPFRRSVAFSRGGSGGATAPRPGWGVGRDGIEQPFLMLSRACISLCANVNSKNSQRWTLVANMARSRLGGNCFRAINFSYFLGL